MNCLLADSSHKISIIITCKILSAVNFMCGKKKVYGEVAEILLDFMMEEISLFKLVQRFPFHAENWLSCQHKGTLRIFISNISLVVLHK